MARRIETDVLIIGGGLSGCMAAINAADHGARVAIMETSMVSLLRNFAF